MNAIIRRQASKDAYENVQFFANTCGMRVAGTPAVLKATDYLEACLEECGLEIETHDFEVPIADYENSQLRIQVNGNWVDMPHIPAMFAGDTPEGGVTLPFVYVGNGSDQLLEENDIRGKAVMITRDVYMNYPDIGTYRKLHKYGAKMVIFTTEEGQHELPSVYANYELRDDMAMLPTVIMLCKDALLLLQYNVENVFYEVKYGVIKKGKSRNIIARLKGTDLSDQEIMLSGHIDSAYGSLGVVDDAGGCVVAMETIKYYALKKAQGKPLHRTLTCAIWSGHEPGSHGSKYYILDHPEVIRKTKFIANYDIVGHALADYQLIVTANDEVIEILSKINEEKKMEWPITQQLVTAGDPFNFAGKQIPYFFCMDNHIRNNHSVGDNLSLITPSSFEIPIDFSVALVEALDELNEIPQGYPEDMNRKAKESAEKYGKIYID